LAPIKAQLEAADFEADGLVLNPLDLARLMTLKDADGNYLLRGPMSPEPPTLWGCRIVATNSMSVDKFLIGSFARAATLYQREATVVEVSTEHSDYFTRNLVAIRAEERVAPVVGQPGALIYADFGNV
jgi:HK97 family phage major capsid protein